VTKCLVALPFIATLCTALVKHTDLCGRNLLCVFFRMQAFPGHEVECIHDFELHHSRRPKVLVQTAGHVAGAAYYYQRSDLSNDPWPASQVLPLSYCAAVLLGCISCLSVHLFVLYRLLTQKLIGAAKPNLV